MSKPISWPPQLDRSPVEIAAQMRRTRRFRLLTIFVDGFARGYIAALLVALWIGLFVLLCWALTP